MSFYQTPLPKQWSEVVGKYFKFVIGAAAVVVYAFFFAWYIFPNLMERSTAEKLKLSDKFSVL